MPAEPALDFVPLEVAPATPREKMLPRTQDDAGGRQMRRTG